jgi:nitroreductase / dihydropteridine reductase
MHIVDCAKKRYAAKAFDKAKPIPADAVQAMKELLRLSPSSVNSQPWHFIMGLTDAGKARIAKAAEGHYVYNKPKILNAGAVVVFCARTGLDDAYLQKLLDCEQADGRFATPEARAGMQATRETYVNLHKKERNDVFLWTSKQVYLNAGAFLLGVSSLGLDAVPIEGFDAPALDREFGLTAKGFASAVIVAVGHHAADDFNFGVPKSRLPMGEVVEEV